LVGVAVNVTLVPEQMADDGDAAILTLAATAGFTTIVIVLEVAGLPVAHVFEDVMTQAIVFPFVNAASVYVALLVPTFTPFFFHW
jgi:hypothetical protein